MKKRRLAELVALHRKHSHERNKEDVGKTYEVLIESVASKSDDQLRKKFSEQRNCFSERKCKPGEYVQVKVVGTLPVEL